MPSVTEGSREDKGSSERGVSSRETASALVVDLQITPLASDAGCWEPRSLLWQLNCPERREVYKHCHQRTMESVRRAEEALATPSLI